MLRYSSAFLFWFRPDNKSALALESPHSEPRFLLSDVSAPFYQVRYAGRRIRKQKVGSQEHASKKSSALSQNDKYLNSHQGFVHQLFLHLLA